MPKIDFKTYLPHFLVVVAFFVLVSIYFSPLVFQGKTMNVHDIVQYQGMTKEINDLRQKYGEEPFWTNAMFSGMPNTLINMNQWGNLVKPIHQFAIQFPKYPASLVIIGLVCFYLMLLAFEVHWMAAIVGAIGFAFSSFTFISLVAGHNAKVACMMYMPLVIAGMALAYKKNWLMGASVFGIGLALQIVNNHVQITYYLIFIGVIYFAVEFINALKIKSLPQFLKATAGLGLAALLAFATHAGYYLSIQEYSKYTIRGKSVLKPLEENKEAIREDGLDRDYVFEYSYSIDEPLTFLMADYYGGASGLAPEKYKNVAKVMRDQGYDPNQVLNGLSAYFGEQRFVAGPMYMGCIIGFLFIFSLFAIKNPIKWGLLAATVLGILLAYGRNFPLLNYFLFDYFPLYNKFRSVTMAVVIPQFCMSLLGMLALQTVINSKKKEEFLKPLYYSLGAVVGLAVLIFIGAGSANFLTQQELDSQLPNWLMDAISQDRKAVRTGDALRTVVFIVLVAGLLYFYFKNKVNQMVTIVSIGLLTLIDLWSVDKRYLNEGVFGKKVMETFYAPNEADQYIMEDKDLNYRVLNLDNPFNESRTSYFHKSVGGYSPAKLRRYQDLVERVISVEMEKMIEKLKKQENAFAETPVINMLNTRYIIAGEDARAVIPNDNALGNAWFVPFIYSVNSPDEEIKALETFNSANTAVIDISKFKTSADKYNVDTTATITLTAYKPYDLTYKSKNSQNGFAVFSEIYYPKGWSATIDGKEAAIKQVNYVLRGLEIPAGEHIVQFTMVNEKYVLGNTIGIIASVLLIAGVLAVAFVSFGKKNNG
ncbi:MAG: YfhO family protein [Cytophagales bacterium]